MTPFEQLQANMAASRGGMAGAMPPNQSVQPEQLTPFQMLQKNLAAAQTAPAAQAEIAPVLPQQSPQQQPQSFMQRAFPPIDYSQPMEDIPGQEYMSPASFGTMFGTIDDVMRAGIGGFTFGLSDKIAAAGNALIGQGNYADNVSQELARSAKFKEDQPVLGYGADVIGSLLGAGKLFKAMGSANPIMKSSALGAGMGGASAFGSAQGTPEEVAQQTAKGVAAGGALGAALPVVGGALMAQAGRIPEGVRDLALRAEELGIKISPSQLTDSKFVKFLESTLDRIPLVYKPAEKQLEQFTQAVSRTFGENSPAITQDVMLSAKKRIGGMFDSVLEKTPQIKTDADFFTKLQNVETEAAQVLGENLAPIQRQIKTVMEKAADGVMDTKAYRALTSKGSPLDRAASSSDPNVSYYARQLRDVLDDALERSAPADVLETLRTARQQYKNMKTIEDLAEKADASGLISPALLRERVRQSYDNFAYTGAGDLGDLARIGQQFLKQPPSSGTAERMMIGGGLLGGGAALANPSLMIPGAAATGGLIAGGNLARAAINSQMYRNALLGRGGQTQKQMMITGNALGAPVIGRSPPEIQSRGQ